jgi:hypothetical protein
VILLKREYVRVKYVLGLIKFTIARKIKLPPMQTKHFCARKKMLYQVPLGGTSLRLIVLKFRFLTMVSVSKNEVLKLKK